MDILKRDLAPLSKEAWQEIDSRAEEVLKAYLSARKVISVNGPKGWDFTSISEGRLASLEEKEGEVKTGVYKVKPLVEARISFTLNRWEMDNITRGAKDIDLATLEEAVKKIAEFEDNAIYKGLQQGDIQGLEQAVVHGKINFGTDESSILEAIDRGIITLRENFVEGPLALIVGKEALKRLSRASKYYPLKETIERLIDGKIIFSNTLVGALLLPYNHEDLQLTIGQDFAIGYEDHDSQEVRLFITESFTFRVLDENIIISYNL